jgi:hypothetical protein
VATHLYCLLPGAADVPPASLAGIGGARVRALAIGASAAWVSDVPEAGAPVTAASLTAHDAVTRAALERATPLPARFGQRFATDEACRRALLRRADAIADALAEVDGCAEMRVVLVPAPEHGPTAPSGVAGSSGREYLESVRTRLHGARALHERGALLRSSLAPLARLARRDALAVRPGTGAPIVVAHLVGAADVAGWRLAADAVLPTAVRPGERVAVTGPVAPWTFAELADVGPDA